MACAKRFFWPGSRRTFTDSDSVCRCQSVVLLLVFDMLIYDQPSTIEGIRDQSGGRLSCQLGRRDQDPLNEPLSDFQEEGGLSPTADDVKEWRGAGSAVRSFMEPLSQNFIVFREAGEPPHARSVEVSVPHA